MDIKIIATNTDVLRDIGVLEEDMVKQFPYEIPSEYDYLPQLKGRAVVELTIKKANNQKFDLDGQLFEQGHLTLVIDGYSAPVTGGCFVDLVNRGFYDGMKVIRSDGFVIQTGDPEGPDVRNFVTLHVASHKISNWLGRLCRFANKEKETSPIGSICERG
jgi:peptidylprolyl isomerase